MAASVSTPKTVTQGVAPHLSASVLTALMAIAPENMTVAQHNQITDALARIPKGEAPGTTIGALLT
jgi:hypothetical protein